MFISFSCKHLVIRHLQINVVLKTFAEIRSMNKRTRGTRLAQMPCADFPISKPYQMKQLNPL